jgi:hypothetical protein
VIEYTQQHSYEYFEGQEYGVLKHYDFEDVRVADSEFPVLESLDAILDAVLDFSETTYCQVLRIATLDDDEMKQFYRRNEHCCLFTKSPESASTGHPPHQRQHHVDQTGYKQQIRKLREVGIRWEHTFKCESPLHNGLAVGVVLIELELVYVMKLAG